MADFIHPDFPEAPETDPPEGATGKAKANGKAEGPRPLKYWRIADMQRLPKPEYMVDKNIPARAQSVIFSPSGHYKTTTALDMIVHVAFDMPWHGHAVKPCPIIYVANEDAYTFARQRVLGHLDYYKLTEERLIVIPGDVSLTDPEIVDRLLVTAAEAFPGEDCGIVFDTWDRSLGADPDKTAEVVPAVERLDELLKRGARFVLTLSHSPWSSPERTKGAVSYWASQGARIRLERDEVTGRCQFDLVHQKNGPSGLHLEFEYEAHAFTLDGETLTTLIPKRLYDAPDRKPIKTDQKPGHGPVQRDLLNELRKLERRHPGGVDEADLKSAFVGALAARRKAEGREALEPKQNTGKFTTTLEGLIARGDVDRLDDQKLLPS